MNVCRLLAAGMLLCAALPGRAACPVDAAAQAPLQQASRQGFAWAAVKQPDVLVDTLVACLDDPDPALRDGVAYTALSQWMRTQAPDATALRRVRDALYGRLAAPEADGFGKPFAALVLAEVARADRIRPWMTVGERARMVERAAGFLEGVRDYRGFVDGEGWRHGVAHGADWLMQLALNPALDSAQLQRIVAAVDRQLMPDHAYVFDEPARLARPLLIAARRGARPEAEWTAWFRALPARLGDPAVAWNDEAWLARRHDLRALLLEVQSQVAGDPQALAPVAPGVAIALKGL